MSYENTERRKSNEYFRISMDIGMGLFYSVIGGLVLYAKSFGKMPMPPAVAYVLGGMMLIGGLFRLYRGIRAVLPGKKTERGQ